MFYLMFYQVFYPSDDDTWIRQSLPRRRDQIHQIQNTCLELESLVRSMTITMLTSSYVSVSIQWKPSLSLIHSLRLGVSTNGVPLLCVLLFSQEGIQRAKLVLHGSYMVLCVRLHRNYCPNYGSMDLY
jgi:hypothetical protein